MAALLSRVQTVVNAALNVADTYTATPDAGSRLYAQQVIDCALSIDGELICENLKNATWSHRVDFQQSSTLAHGANLPAHVGPIDAVLIGGKFAEWAPLEQIEKEREIVTLGVGVTPHYNADGTTFAHNGSGNATLKSCNYTRGVVLQSPDENEGGVIRGVLSFVASPEGEAPELQAEYRAQYEADKQRARGGEAPLPFEEKRATAQ